MHHKNRKQVRSADRGFTLVEVLMATGVMGLGAVAISQMTLNQAQMQAKASAKTDFGQAISYIDSVMSNDSSCAQALGLVHSPLPFVPSIDSTLKVANAAKTYSQGIVIYGANGSPYLTADPTSPNNQLGSLKIAKIALLYDSGIVPTLSVSGSSTLKILQAHIYINVVNKIGNANLVNQVTGVNLQIDTSTSKITACSGFRLGNGSSVNIPNCNPGQVLFANGTGFECVSTGCPPNWHQTNNSTDYGFATAGTDLSKSDPSLPSGYASNMSCAIGTNLGQCKTFVNPPFQCDSPKSGTGSQTSACVDGLGNQSSYPYQLGKTYCTNPPDCSSANGLVTFNYCPLSNNYGSGPFTAVAGAPGSPPIVSRPAGIHTTADCDSLGASIYKNGSNFMCKVPRTSCPAGWSSSGWSETTNHHSGCGGSGCGSVDSGSHSWDANMNIESKCISDDCWNVGGYYCAPKCPSASVSFVGCI